MPSSCTSFGCIAASLRRCIAAPPAIFCPCLLILSHVLVRTQWLLASDGWLARSWLAAICSWLLPTATYNKPVRGRTLRYNFLRDSFVKPSFGCTRNCSGAREDPSGH
ncbi:hypothetical protein V8C86DRAFT_1020710 [Haematococcus lacustris]